MIYAICKNVARDDGGQCPINGNCIQTHSHNQLSIWQSTMRLTRFFIIIFSGSFNASAPFNRCTIQKWKNHRKNCLCAFFPRRELSAIGWNRKRLTSTQSASRSSAFCSCSSHTKTIVNTYTCIAYLSAYRLVVIVKADVLAQIAISSNIALGNLKPKHRASLTRNNIQKHFYIKTWIMADTNRDELIAQFVDVTGATSDRAQFYLESANWTLQVNNCEICYVSRKKIK